MKVIKDVTVKLCHVDEVIVSSDNLPTLPSTRLHPYKIDGYGMVWVKPYKGGYKVYVPLQQHVPDTWYGVYMVTKRHPLTLKQIEEKSELWDCMYQWKD